MDFEGSFWRLVAGNQDAASSKDNNLSRHSVTRPLDFLDLTSLLNHSRMMTYVERLQARIDAAQSRLCVGLDPRPDQIDGAVADFLFRVIDDTSPFAACFKPNSAYFEALGSQGFDLLERTIRRIPDEIPVILDAKRSDIGETQFYYARACFDILGADAVTLNPWLGTDTLEPYLNFPGKGVYLLAVTSNSGAKQFALRRVDDRWLFEDIQAVAVQACEAGRPTSVGLVTGLTNIPAEVLDRIADLPLLIPGLGAQGGDLSFLSQSTRQAPIVVNASRGILYHHPELSFERKARQFRDQIQEVFA